MIESPTVTKWIAGIAALLGAAAWWQPSVAGSDLWWHLASGRQIWRTGIPSTDEFSWTFAGKRWMNHEWLWDVAYWGIWQISPSLVAWGTVAILLATYALAGCHAWRTSASLTGSVLAMWLAAWTSYWFHDIRPHVVTLLFLNIVLVTRHQRWAPWLWPSLIMLWANIHGGFLFGIGAIGLFVLVESVQTSLTAGRVVFLRREWISVVVCLMCWVLNPVGWQLLEPVATLLDSTSTFRQVVEWQAPTLSLNMSDYNGRLTLMTVLALTGAIFTWRRSPYLVLLAAVTLTMAWTSRRFIPLFALTSIPLIAVLIGRLIDTVSMPTDILQKPTTGLVTSLLAFLIATSMFVSHARYTPDLLVRWTKGYSYPEAALAYMNAVDVPTNVLNHYNWGGYIMLNEPRYKVFIDGRAQLLYDNAIAEDAGHFAGGTREFQRRLAKYPQADIALFPASTGSTQRLHELGWKVIYADPIAVVQVKPDSALLKHLDNTRSDAQPSDHVQTRLAQAHKRFRRDSGAHAVDELEAIVAEAPLFRQAWGALLLAQAKLGVDRSTIGEIAARAIRVDPRFTTQIRRWEGSAYETIGEWQAAISAFRAGHDGGPFALANQTLDARIAKLERRLRAAQSIP